MIVDFTTTHTHTTHPLIQVYNPDVMKQELLVYHKKLLAVSIRSLLAH